MSKEKLIVKNFGPIKDVELELGKVNIFIGEQAGGKSTLAKLIAIFRDWDFIKNRNNISSFQTYNISSFFLNKTKLIYHSGNYRIEYENGKFTFQLNSNLEELLIKIKVLGQKRNDSKNALELSEEYLSVRSKITNTLRQAVYFPAERLLITVLSKSLFNLILNQFPLPRFLTKFGSDFEISKIVISDYFSDEFKLSYKFTNEGEFIGFNNNTIKLSESSTGIQALIPIIIVAEYFSKEVIEEGKKFTYIIEEPELSLYPTYQNKLTHFLIDKANLGDNELVITTHSPYILTSISNLILAGNTLKKHPELKKEITQLVPEKYHLDYQDVQAYYVENGTAHSIMDDEYKTIDASKIDDVSNDLGETFDKLLELKYQK